MIRIAYLVGTWPSPGETFLAREVGGLREHGVEVHLVALQPGPGGPAPEVWYRSTRPAAGGGGRGRARLSGVGLRRLRNRSFARRLVAFCRERDCQLLHAAWAGAPAEIAWLAHRLGGPRYTIAGHAADVFTLPTDPAVWAGAAGVTVCNRAAWRELARRGELAGKLALLPHGLPLDLWPVREREPAGRPVVFGVGRLVAKKGFDLLLRASAELTAGGLDHDLVIVGEGPERARLEALAAELGVRVDLPGQRPVAEVAAAMVDAAVLVLPSRVDPAGDRDGLANVLLEAMATGVPVVTTSAGSATDAVRDGRTGLLVPPERPAAVASAVARLLRDDGLRRRLAAAARTRIEQDYDLRVNTARLARWLARAAGGEGGGHVDDRQ